MIRSAAFVAASATGHGSTFVISSYTIWTLQFTLLRDRFPIRVWIFTVIVGAMSRRKVVLANQYTRLFAVINDTAFADIFFH